MKVHKIICPECASSLNSKAGIEEGTSIHCPKCKSKFTVAAVEAEEEIVEDFEVVDEEEEETPKKPAAKPGLKPLSQQKKVAADEDDEDEEETPKKPAAKSGLKPLSKQRKPETEEDDEEEEEAPRKPAAKSTLKPLSKRKADEDDEDEEEEDRPRRGSGAFSNMDSKPARKKRAVDDDEDEDESPRSKRRSRDEDDDEDDDRPRSKRRSRDEDDDDDEPQSAYGKLKSNIYVRASVLGVLLIIMGVLGYLLYDKYTNKKKDDGGTAQKDDDDPSKPVIKDDRKPGGTQLPKSKGPVIPKGANRHQGEGRVHVAAQGFSMVKPADWEIAPNTAGAILTWFGPKSAFQVNLNVRAQAYDGTPIDRIGEAVKKSLPKLPGYRFVEDGLVTIDGQQAYFIIHETSPNIKGAPAFQVTAMQYFVIARNKTKAFILTFADITSEFDGRRKLFEEMASSLRTD